MNLDYDPHDWPVANHLRAKLIAAVFGGIVVAVIVNWPVHDERRLDAMAYSNLGTALGAQGDLPAATRFLRRAVEGHPQSAEAHFNLGYALSLQGDHAAAVYEYETALRIEPTLIYADYLAAVSLERLGDNVRAVRHYQRALELDSVNVEVRAALARLEDSRP